MPPKSTNYPLRPRSEASQLPTTNWRQRRQGFTLVELLITISIIAILSAVAYVSFTTAQDRGRDARRKADLKAIKTALVSYYQDKDGFPPPCPPCIDTVQYNSNGSGTWIPNLAPTYIPNLPNESRTGGTYAYVVSRDRRSFSLWAQLDNTNDPELTTACNPPPPLPSVFNYCIESPQ